MKKTFIAFAAFLAMAGTVQAQTFASPASPTRFLLGMGVSRGGEDLAHVTFEDGFSHNIRTGGLVYFTAGADYRISPAFSVQGTLNYHYDGNKAKNGDVKFERFPIELIAYYQPHPQWRVGGGIRYTAGPKLSSSGVAEGMDIKFDDATSAVIEAEYFVTPKVGIKLRYVNETLKVRGYEVDANHVGLSGNYYF
jgi:hypothetical protein